MAKSSILGIVLVALLVGLLESLTSMSSVARAAEPEADPSVVVTPLAAPQRGPVAVAQAPGVDLPPQIAADVRAAVEDALAGRTPPGVPIEITLEAGGVLLRVGSLWRRITITHWDYQALRTVALHVLDLLQPAPDVPAPAPASPVAEPAASVVAEAPGAERATEPAGPWSLHGSVAGARGVEGPDPWMVAIAAGAAWTYDWLRIGLEVGWDHAVVRHPDGLTTVNYDAVPLRLVLAAQNSAVSAGVRVGVAVYRVTGEQAYREVTPLVGPFLALRLPIAGRFHGFLVGGFDYFGHRTELAMFGFDTAYSTPQVAPYVGVVVEAVLRP